jgi:uncharacterized membrane protein YdjX (TVP38/TMEM64 family)
MRTGTVIKIAVAAIAVALLVLVWGFTPVSSFTNPEVIAAAMADLAASPWRLAIVLGCFLVAGLIFFPMLLLIVACAAVFGPLGGFLYSSIGLLASASLDYAIGSWLGREMLQRALGSSFDSMRNQLMRRGLITTVFIRVIPGSPFQVVSLVAGASAIRFRDYLIGTAIGIMVPVILLSFATEQAAQLLTKPTAGQVVLLVGVMVVWVGVALGAQVLLDRITKRRGGR